MFLNFLMFKDFNFSCRSNTNILVLIVFFLSSLLLFSILIQPISSLAQSCDPFTESCLTDAAITPPQQAVADSILPVSLNNGIENNLGVCPHLVNNGNNNDDRQQDLLERCTEMILDSGVDSQLNNVRNALGELSVDKLASEGSSFVETSNQNIGSRIAALRGSATAISLGVFSLNINGSSYNGTSRAIAFNYDEDKNANPNVYDIKNDKFLTVNDAINPGTLLALASSDQSIEDQLTSQSRLGLFINGEFTFWDKDATSREAGFDFNIFGITGGADYMISENFFLGIALNYSHNDIDLDSDGGELDSNGYSASIYGTYYLDNFYFDLQLKLKSLNIKKFKNIIILPEKFTQLPP